MGHGTASTSPLRTTPESMAASGLLVTAQTDQRRAVARTPAVEPMMQEEPLHPVQTPGEAPLTPLGAAPHRIAPEGLRAPRVLFPEGAGHAC